jgi:formylglycine-generating enzyme required for sulfatase activity
MIDRLLFFFLVCFFLATSVVFAMHAGEKHKEGLSESLQKAPAESFSFKKDNSLMIRVPVGNFKRGSSFVENKRHLKRCRKYDKSCQLWWFSDEYPDKLIFLDSYWIDIYEVTNEKYLEFVLATGHRFALDETCE